MDTTLLRYTDLPIGDRAAFELVCARHGFAPVHFDISACAKPDEPEYERLNEVMKWSLVIRWLNESKRGDSLGFLRDYPVERKAWFPGWVKQPQQARLRFRDWDKVGFHPKGYLGTTTEALPSIKSRPFWQMGLDGWVITGGVSLAGVGAAGTRLV